MRLRGCPQEEKKINPSEAVHFDRPSSPQDFDTEESRGGCDVKEDMT
jgi:hypothetical protein